MTTLRNRSVNPLPPSVSIKKAPKLLDRFHRGNNVSVSPQTHDPTLKSTKPPLKPKPKFRLFSSNGRTRRRTETVEMEDDHDLNVMEWLQRDCPQDVVPKILAYAGPKQTAVLAKTNRHWNKFVQKEGTWRVLCEELYKWKPGDAEPDSWAEYYRLTPCVPVDYSTVHKALSEAVEFRSRRNEAQPLQTSVRIMIRPGKYFLKESIVIRASVGTHVTIESMVMPENIFRPPPTMGPICTVESLPETRRAPTSRRLSFRSIMKCARPAVVDETENTFSSMHDENVPDGTTSVPKHASLILRTRRPNEPVFRVRQGMLHLRGIDVQHSSYGLDIWNGNAAIQVQPPYPDEEDASVLVPRPIALLERVQVTSQSGRGIVTIDGGKIFIRECAVIDCAATGIYIGGPGSQAVVEQSDVVRNGAGNRMRRGIARGHSGIYLEQGRARVVDCNISKNTLTGISAVSSTNAILTLEGTDLVANGTYQLELPSFGTPSRQRSLFRDNNIAITGSSRTRSGFDAVTSPPPPPPSDESRSTLLAASV